MLNYICKIVFFFLLPVPLLAQQGQAQKALEKIGQIERSNRFLPSAVRVGAEVANYGFSFIDDKIDRTWEFTADVDFHKYFLVVDYGYTAFDVSETYFDYSSAGNYFRIGPDINFIKKRKHHNVLFLGFRYGRATFDENVLYSTTNEIEQQELWPESTITESYDNLSARWIELNTGMRVNVIQNFYLGFTLRLKFALAVNADKTFTSYYVPGYGKESFRPNFGGSYYIYYRLQFRDKYKDVFKSRPQP